MAFSWGNLEVPLPGLPKNTSIDDLVKGWGLAHYIALIANYLIVITIIAGLMIVVGAGYIYMTAGGNGKQVETAKTWIISAVLGIALALTAAILLSTINPRLIP